MPQDKLRLFLISTCMKQQRLDQIYLPLFKSLRSSSLELIPIMLFQETTEEELKNLQKLFPDIHLIHSETRLPLSQARNLGLKFITEKFPPQKNDYISFPDDDAYYFEGFFEELTTLYLNSQTDFIIGSYNEVQAPPERASSKAEISPQIIRYHASSITAFFQRHYLTKIDKFDERLGVGNRFGSAEDNDFFLRLYKAGARGIYDPSLVLYHPIKNGGQERPEYWSGGVAFAIKHLFTYPNSFRVLLGRYRQGLKLICSGKITISYFLKICFTSLKFFWQKAP